MDTDSIGPSVADTGLVLTGGGARAAYQVGVLDAVRVLLDHAGCLPKASPFGVVCGTSAGALNAAAYASQCHDFAGSVQQLVRTWSGFHADQIYLTDTIDVLRSGTGLLTMLSAGWAIRRTRKLRPKSLFDNTPLAGLLHRTVNLSRIEENLSGGTLRALAVTASDYSSGRHVTFYQTAETIEPWARSQRIAVPGQICIEHLLASSAIPFLFPAVALTLEGRPAWFGDGSMRQLAPISPAIHLGARRVLVVGAGQLNAPDRFLPPPGENELPRYPSLAQIAGHAMSSIFLDSLAMDIERIERVNKTVSLIPLAERAGSPLREIEVLVIAPSQRVDAIAARHIQALPRPVRAMLRAVGATDAKGAALASYLLFEESFTRELMQLGYNDTMLRRAEVLKFFRPNAPAHSEPA